MSDHWKLPTTCIVITSTHALYADMWFETPVSYDAIKWIYRAHTTYHGAHFNYFQFTFAAQKFYDYTVQLARFFFLFVQHEYWIKHRSAHRFAHFISLFFFRLVVVITLHAMSFGVLLVNRVYCSLHFSFFFAPFCRCRLEWIAFLLPHWVN